MPDNKKSTVYMDTGGVYLDTGMAIERVNINGENKLKVRPKSPSPGMIYIPGKPKVDDPPRQTYALNNVVKRIVEIAWRDGAPRLTRDEMSKLLQQAEHFPGISTTQARAAWEKAKLPPNWRVRGRRNAAERIGTK